MDCMARAVDGIDDIYNIAVDFYGDKYNLAF